MRRHDPKNIAYNALHYIEYKEWLVLYTVMFLCYDMDKFEKPFNTRQMAENAANPNEHVTFTQCAVCDKFIHGPCQLKDRNTC